ncbi:MAG: hypothetical protein JWQ75_2750, partial [Pseudarthrobacter sp.]|nr:hypothetical protein [Pseudarthrobacter sp.]
FALAGEPLPMPANAAASFSQQGAQLPADGRELSTAQLAELRTEGWVCPELESLGFHVLAARATTLDGRPAVEMELSDGQHYARVLEQHSLDGESRATLPAGSGTPSGDGQVWIRNMAPWTAVYASPESTFTYESDLPADRADDALPVLQQLSDLAGTGVSAAAAFGPAADAAGTPAESLGDRIGRGIHKMLQFLDP